MVSLLDISSVHHFKWVLKYNKFLFFITYFGGSSNDIICTKQVGITWRANAARFNNGEKYEIKYNWNVIC